MTKALVWLIVLRCLKKKEHSLLFSVKRNIWISSGSTWTRVWLELISAVEDTSQLHLQNLYSVSENKSCVFFQNIAERKSELTLEQNNSEDDFVFIILKAFGNLKSCKWLDDRRRNVGLMVGMLVHRFGSDWNISTNIGCAFMKFGTDIPSPRRIFLYAIMRLKFVDGWIVTATQFATSRDHIILWIHLARLQDGLMAITQWFNQSESYEELLNYWQLWAMFRCKNQWKKCLYAIASVTAELQSVFNWKRSKEQHCRAFLHGKDVFALLLSGSGKSLIYEWTLPWPVELFYCWSEGWI